MASNGTEIRNGRNTLALLLKEIEVKGEELKVIAPRVDALKSEESEVAARVNVKLAEEIELDARIKQKQERIDELNEKGVATSETLIKQTAKVQQNTGVLKYQEEQIASNKFELRELEEWRKDAERKTLAVGKIKAAREAEATVLEARNQKLAAEGDVLEKGNKKRREEKTLLEGDVSVLKSFSKIDDERMAKFMEETGYIVGKGRIKRKKKAKR